jgi:hypothetical protein
MMPLKIYFLSSISQVEITNETRFPRVIFVSFEKISDVLNMDKRISKRICADDLFSLFTADIIAKGEVFIR